MGRHCHAAGDHIRIQILHLLTYLIFVKNVMDQFEKGERVVQDFNIKQEAGGSKRALVRLFEANVTNTNIDIHFKWAGKGTCCIPVQSTFGPLVSAIHVSHG